VFVGEIRRIVLGGRLLGRVKGSGSRCGLRSVEATREDVVAVQFREVQAGGALAARSSMVSRGRWRVSTSLRSGRRSGARPERDRRRATHANAAASEWAMLRGATPPCMRGPEVARSDGVDLRFGASSLVSSAGVA